MVEFDSAYPGYSFGRHKGYSTAGHIACLQRIGPCPIHRHNFQPVADATAAASAEAVADAVADANHCSDRPGPACSESGE
jgi:ribonuclease HII